MTRPDDVERLLVAIDGRTMRPSALRELAEQHFGPDAERVVATAVKRGKLVRDTRGMMRPGLGGAS